MEVFIDSDLFNTDQTSIGGIIEAAKKQVDPTGRMIVEVRIDGASLTDDQLDHELDHEPDAEEIQLVTADPIELVLDILDEARAALVEARTAQNEAAGDLQQDKPTKAMDGVKLAIAVWQQVQQTVSQTILLLDMPIDDMMVGERPAHQIIDDLLQQLMRLKDQLISEDWVALADALEFEMSQTADIWDQLLTALADRIRAQKQI
ncbi:MAG: hypothetical protein ACYTGQ_13290 [Planctomycetota bacterium]|jgi:hypothetical protein